MGLSIGTKIKELRQKNDMTQTELAARLGVTRAIISAYEKGNRHPSFHVVQELSKIFDVSGHYFFENGEVQKEAITVDISDLTNEQQKIIILLIKEFRKNNNSKKISKTNTSESNLTFTWEPHSLKELLQED